MGKTASLANIGTIADSSLGFRNRIINGDMRIDQRNAGASVTITNLAAITYTLDRWLADITQASKFSVEQTITGVSAPVGFTDYLAVTSSSAYSVLTGDYFYLGQKIEGYNVADLAWGTASAATVTLSFWVRSSLTGTFGGTVRNGAGNRSYPFTYTISAANTWEQKSITIAGDTSGTWLTTNGAGLQLAFGIGVGTTYSGTAGAWAAGNFVSATGATSVVGTNGATFYITGVQLEKGSTATSFDYRPIGTELQLCQRYYWRNTAGASYTTYGSGLIPTTTTANIVVNFPVPMRSAPTFTQSTTAVYDGTTSSAVTGFGTNYISTQTANVALTGLSGMVVGRGAYWSANNNPASYIDASSEL